MSRSAPGSEARVPSKARFARMARSQPTARSSRMYRQAPRRRHSTGSQSRTRNQSPVSRGARAPMTSAVQGISVMLATQPKAGPPNPKAVAVAALSATTAAAPAVSPSTVRLVTGAVSR